MKGSIPVEWLVGAPFNEYARGGRTPARSGDCAKIVG